MILLKKLDDSSVAVNLETIKYMESCPDTVIFFLNGDSILVKESLSEIVEKVTALQAKILKQSQEDLL